MRPSVATSAASRTGGPPLPSTSVPLVMIVVPVASFMVGGGVPTSRDRKGAGNVSRSLAVAARLEASQRPQERVQQPQRRGRVLPVNQVPDAGQIHPRAIGQRGGQRLRVV